MTESEIMVVRADISDWPCLKIPCYLEVVISSNINTTKNCFFLFSYIVILLIRVRVLVGMDYEALLYFKATPKKYMF